MSAQEIIESQMNDMRREIAEANKQIGRIEECLELFAGPFTKFEVTDDESIGYRYCYTNEQRSLMSNLLLEMRNACKRV